MFVAHLPAGWLFARTLRNRAARRALLVGAIAPDLDLVWWWLVDHGAVHHHRYLTHLPAVWALAALGCALLLRGGARRVALALCAGVLLHIALDSVAGDVAWLWPFDHRLFSLVTVPPTGGHWVWSFVGHWSFGIELVIVAVAIAVARTHRFGVLQSTDIEAPSVPHTVTRSRPA